MRRSQLLKGLINFDPDGRQFREDVRQLIKAAKEGRSFVEILKEQFEDDQGQFSALKTVRNVIAAIVARAAIYKIIASASLARDVYRTVKKGPDAILDEAYKKLEDALQNWRKATGGKKTPFDFIIKPLEEDLREWKASRSKNRPSSPPVGGGGIMPPSKPPIVEGATTSTSSLATGGGGIMPPSKPPLKEVQTAAPDVKRIAQESALRLRQKLPSGYGGVDTAQLKNLRGKYTEVAKKIKSRVTPSAPVKPMRPVRPPRYFRKIP